MQITITIKDADIKGAIDNMLENSLYEQYSEDALKMAKVPKKAALVKELMADPQVLKAITNVVNDADVLDYLYDYIYDQKIDRVDSLGKACMKAEDELQAEHDALAAERAQAAEEAKEAAIVARTIKALEKQGYKVVKA